VHDQVGATSATALQPQRRQRARPPDCAAEIDAADENGPSSPMMTVSAKAAPSRRFARAVARNFFLISPSSADRWGQGGEIDHGGDVDATPTRLRQTARRDAREDRASRQPALCSAVSQRR